MKVVRVIGFPGVLVVVGLLISGPFVNAEEPDDLRISQQTQEQARTLARELVSGILEIQIRQLRENGLVDLPIYQEIVAMSQNVDALVDQQMQEVVDLLAAAQAGTRQQRLEHFELARTRTRDVVVRLLAERQRLLRRLQVARLAAEVRQVIVLENRALEATSTLNERPASQRESAALATVQDQRDVKSLFLVLVETLTEVSGWGGQTGAAASDALRILKAAQTDTELDQAAEALESARYDDAADRQRNALRGLRALLEKVEEAQGVVPSDRQAAVQQVRELIKQQRQVRDQVRTSEPRDDRRIEALVEQQAEIHKRLGQLDQALNDLPAGQTLLEQAKASAYEATAQLFETRPSQAVAEQERVIASLVELERVLQQAMRSDQTDRTAEQLARQVQQLDELKQALEQTAEQQRQVSDIAAQADRDTQLAQRAVAEALDSAAETARQTGDLPGAIDSRLTDAQQAVAQSVRALENLATETASERQSAAGHAERAVLRALAETEAQLADAQRRRLAVQVGELARAAEALERAAASQRDLAREAKDAAESSGWTAERAAELGLTQAEVQTVSEKIAEGVRVTAPDVSDALSQTAEPLARTAQLLEDARQSPGEASKPYAAQAVHTAGQASRELEASAAALRQRVAESADQLVDVADRQSEQVAQIQRPVEQALADTSQDAAEALRRLQQAWDTVLLAQAQQQRAAGRAAAADAAELGRHVSDLTAAQRAASAAAEDLARGRANTPLEAAARQQDVAEAAEQFARRADGQLADSLRHVAQAAAEAARQMLAGSPARARTARQMSERSLAEAHEIAQDAAARAAQDPAGPVDAAAQQQVSQMAAEARKLSESQSPAAAQALTTASGQSALAEQAMQGNDGAALAGAQQQTQDALAEAAIQLERTLRQLAGQQEQTLAAQAEQAGQLAREASRVSPDAAAALQRAQQFTQQGAKSVIDQPDRSAEAVQQAQQSMQQAATSLADRQQQIQRDREVAEAIGNTTHEQQQARAAIAEQAANLESFAARDAGETPTFDELNAAAALERAMDQFAQAQMATGEGAAQISGQQQVANQPIRDALEAASQWSLDLPGPTSLGTGFVPDSPEVTAQQIAGAQATAQAAQAQAAAAGDSQENPSASQQAMQPGSEPQGGSATSNGAAEAQLIEQQWDEEPWFSKLPPSLREAIRASARREPPRGYEERLRRYFESTD
jgi:hypothetical protein